jgi:MFS family permease
MEVSDMMKKTAKSCFMGIAIALMIFSLVGVVFDQIYGGYILLHHQYTKMFLGALIVGAGFGLPSCIYENERIPYPLQVIFHMGIGCAVMLITGFSVGWFPAAAGIGPVILTVVGEIGVSFVLWICFTAHYKKEARSISRKLRSGKL